MSRARTAATAAVAMLASSACAGSDGQWRFLFGPALSFKVLGSEDARHGFYYGVQYAKREPRLAAFGYDPELVLEAYYLQTTGGGFRVWPVTNAHNYGLNLIARYWAPRPGSFRVYIEGGWGLDYINRLTYDLYTRLNSSPQLGVGALMRSKDHDVQVGLRWKHISNAGTAGNNEGENYLILHFGVRF